MIAFSWVSTPRSGSARLDDIDGEDDAGCLAECETEWLTGGLDSSSLGASRLVAGCSQTVGHLFGSFASIHLLTFPHAAPAACGVLLTPLLIVLTPPLVYFLLLRTPFSIGRTSHASFNVRQVSSL